MFIYNCFQIRRIISINGCLPNCHIATLGNLFAHCLIDFHPRQNCFSGTCVHSVIILIQKEPMWALSYFLCLLERVAGIEPATQPWEGRILPLNYTRTYAMEPMSGLEPLTFALRKHCSTN